MKWRLLGIAFVICAILVIAALLLPTFGELSYHGTGLRNYSSAVQLAHGIKDFASDHDGRYPVHLSELVPDYIPPERYNELLYRPVRRDMDEPFPSPQYDWLYFGAFRNETHPPTILIASPQTFTQQGKKPHRIVVHPDGTINQLAVTQLKEPEFQAKLATTIKELNERAAALMPKPTDSATPIEKPAPP